METNEQPKELTPKEAAAKQAADDNQTIFVLAALMVDLYMATIVRNEAAVGVILPNAGNLLRARPGFVERFKALQQDVLKKSGMEVNPQPPRPRIVMP